MGILKVNNLTDRIIGVDSNEVSLELCITSEDGSSRMVPFGLGDTVLVIKLPEQITCMTNEIQIGPGVDIVNWPDMPDDTEREA